MKAAIKRILAAGLASILTALPALSAPVPWSTSEYYNDYTYYLIGESNDRAERKYLQDSGTWMPNQYFWNTAVIVKLDEGPDVPDAAYGEASAAWIEIYYNCDNGTYGLHGATFFNRAGNRVGSNYVQPNEVEFKPVPQASYLTVAYQAACKNAAPSGYEQVGPIRLEKLIDDDVARWKQSNTSGH